jgi:hypothetical protein
LALGAAEFACRREPHNGFYLNTFGVAQYRAGQYPQALATLQRSHALNARTTSSSTGLPSLALRAGG